MSYGIQQLDTCMYIPIDKQEIAVKAVKELSSKCNLSWVDQEKLKRLTMLADVLECCRWLANLDSQGNITGLEFLSDRLGEDELIFGALAPSVQAGSYILVIGEDKNVWKWSFDGEKCDVVSPEWKEKNLRFPQYHADLQEYVQVLFELNEADRRLATFLKSVQYDENNPSEYWVRIKGTPKEEERRTMFEEAQALDRRWGSVVNELFGKGYKPSKWPSRQELDNYIDWRAECRNIKSEEASNEAVT